MPYFKQWCICVWVYACICDLHIHLHTCAYTCTPTHLHLHTSYYLFFPQVLRSIQGVLPLPQAPSAGSLHKQLAYGLHQLLVSQATCVKNQHDWSLLFTILQYSATGLVQSDPLSPVTVETNTDKMESISIETGNMVANGGVTQHVAILPNRFSVLPEGDLPPHDPEAFFKQCESLALLVRSDHHISSNNFDACLRCVRTFAEVSTLPRALQYDRQHMTPPTKGGVTSSKRGSVPQEKQAPPSPSNDSNTSYTTASLQLLDLLDNLYSKVVLIYSREALLTLPPATHPGGKGGVPGLLWHVAWCPLLLGMARMCYDSRRPVRQTSITYLQRALLAHDLQNMAACEWEACFVEVRGMRTIGEVERGGEEDER